MVGTTLGIMQHHQVLTVGTGSSQYYRYVEHWRGVAVAMNIQLLVPKDRPVI
jgi:hypothetical protein